MELILKLQGRLMKQVVMTSYTYPKEHMPFAFVHLYHTLVFHGSTQQPYLQSKAYNSTTFHA